MSGGVHFGVTGLATMGQHIARNIGRNGFPVVVHNRTAAKVDDLMAEHGSEGELVAARTADELVTALERPRAILLMVKAGGAVDDVLEELFPRLEEGDVVIDGGNSLFTDTERRLRDAHDRGLGYLGCGISGGEEGALHGPSLMPGGSRAAYEKVEPILTVIAAEVDGVPCCTYLGDGGAGHYVKMVHNGIEYADMQLIAEAYDLLRQGLGLSNPEMHDVFSEWNAGDLDSFLIEVTARILLRRDDDGDGWLLDKVLDRAEQKGTGRQTVQSALELGAPVTAIAEAVFSRSLSALHDERAAAATVLPGPPSSDAIERDGFVDQVRDALYASKVVAYAQGFDQLRRAGAEHGWDLPLGEIATIWRGGCIIRARFLDRIRESYEEERDAARTNLLLAPYFADALQRCQAGWRRVVAEAVRVGIPVPAFSSALAYYDGYRRARLPANLIQAQRDLFGAHTYERVDRAGPVHSDWGAGEHQPENEEGRVD